MDLKWFNQPMWRGGLPPQGHSFHAVIPDSNRMVSWCRTPTCCLGYLPPTKRALQVLNKTKQPKPKCEAWCQGLYGTGVEISQCHECSLGAPDSTPLYLCFPPIWDAVDGNLLNPHYLWDHYGDQNKTVLRT
jgi:hypothetical protein